MSPATKVLPIVKIVDDYGVTHNINAYTISDISNDPSGHRANSHTIWLTNGKYLIVPSERALELLAAVTSEEVKVCS
jgi:hypothetical protein